MHSRGDDKEIMINGKVGEFIEKLKILKWISK